jgi:hypothetical protein
MHEDRFEQRLADWLEEGPFEAPERTRVAAFAYADAHPRRNSGIARLARTVTIRMRRAGELRDHGPAVPRAVAVLAAAAILVAAVAGSGVLLLGRGDDRSSIGQLGVAETATSMCVQEDPGTTTTRPTATGEVTQRRGVVLACTLTSGDPRLEGSATFNLNADERAGGGADVWGTARIENGVGAWQGYWVGRAESGSTIHRIEAAYVGVDGYDGLGLRTSQASDGLDGRISGTVARLDALPPASASVITGSSCAVRVLGMISEQGAVTQTRGSVLSCTVDAADPRLAAGAERVVANVDERPDGSATMWGSATLTNDGGAWQETWEGTVEAGYTTHRMTGVAVGSGGYAGLEYRYSQVGGIDLLVRIGDIESVP